MARGLHRLPLEKPIYELEDKIADLETAPLGQQSQEEVQQLRRECADLQKQIFGNLDPSKTRTKGSENNQIVLFYFSFFPGLRKCDNDGSCSSITVVHDIVVLTLLYFTG